MKKVSIYVLLLSIIIGIISGTIFAAEAATVDQNGTAQTLSGTMTDQASLSLDNTDRPDALEDRGEPDGRGHGGHGRHGGSDVFINSDNPVILLMAMMAILMLLAL